MKRQLKKIVAIMLVAAMTISVTACGGENKASEQL